MIPDEWFYLLGLGTAIYWGAVVLWGLALMIWPDLRCPDCRSDDNDISLRFQCRRAAWHTLWTAKHRAEPTFEWQRVDSPGITKLRREGRFDG